MVGQEGEPSARTAGGTRSGCPFGPEADKGPGRLRPGQARPPEARLRGGLWRRHVACLARSSPPRWEGGTAWRCHPASVRTRVAVWRVCIGVATYCNTKKGAVVATGRVVGAVFSPQRIELLLPAGRVPPQRSDGSRVSRVGRRAGLRAVPQSGSARSLLQVSRWSSMELALAGRGQVDVGDCSVIGWGKMFGTGGARRMLSRMFGGVDAGLSLGDLSGGARAFQPGHAAKFAQGPRRSGSSFCCPQAGSRRSGSRVSCIVVSALLARLCRPFVDMIRRKKGAARRSEPRRAAPSHRLTRRLPPTQSQARRARSRVRRPTARAPDPPRTQAHPQERTAR